MFRSCCLRAVYPCQRNRQFIDLCSEDEVVFAEATDGVGPKFNPDVSESFDVKVRMVTIVLSDFGDKIEEIHHGHEILGDPVLANPLAVMRQSPASELIQLRIGVMQSARFDTSFAWFALFRNELPGSLNLHGTIFLRRVSPKYSGTVKRFAK